MRRWQMSGASVTQGISGKGTLPDRDDDPVQRLIVHYYDPTNLMYKNWSKLDAQRLKRGSLSRPKFHEYRVYLRLWLALLYVVCKQLDEDVEPTLLTRSEEFHKCVEDIKVIQKIFAEHKDELRVFRNAQFHFNTTASKQLRFFGIEPDDPIIWAKELHMLIDSFFSEYRICCATEYFTSGRISEGRNLVFGRP
jgi:hypothetical protein